MKVFSVIARHETIGAQIPAMRIIRSTLIETDNLEEVEAEWRERNKIFQNPGGSVSSFYFFANPDQSFLEKNNG